MNINMVVAIRIRNRMTTSSYHNYMIYLDYWAAMSNY